MEGIREKGVRLGDKKDIGVLPYFHRQKKKHRVQKILRVCVYICNSLKEKEKIIRRKTVR